MHKGIILLVKPDKQDATRDDVLSQVNSFMEYYEHSVWDWWVVGGRWTQTLSTKTKEFMIKADKFLKEKSANEGVIDGIILQKVVDGSQPDLQAMWENMGCVGKNPYCNHYEIDKGGQFYDILPLSECLDVVNEWKQDYIEAGKEKLKKAEDWINGKVKVSNYSMYGYCLTIAGKLFQQEFFDGCNVFNTKQFNYSVPEDVTGWWAVMVDVHN